MFTTLPMDWRAEHRLQKFYVRKDMTELYSEKI